MKILFIHIFLGQIWSQNLKFFKLTEIWYSGTLLHVFYDFSVYFFKKFFIHIILGKVGSKVCFSNWMKFGTRTHCYMLITVLMPNFSKYLPFINFWHKLHPKIYYSNYLLKVNIDIRCNFVNLEKTRCS